MQLRSLLLLAPPALMALPVLFAQGQGEPSGPGGLRRLAPLEEGAAAKRERPPFDAEAWRRALTAEDLDLRQRDFERLLDEARRDERVWDFLREAAAPAEPADAGARELAWTARLALRELDRRRPSFGVPPFLRLEGLDDPFTFGELLQQMGVDPGAFPPRAPGWQGATGVDARGRSVRIEQDGDLWRVEIREKDGEDESVRSYEGESLEKILEENPELADDLEVSHLGAVPQGFRMDLDLPLHSPLDQLLRQLEAFREVRPMHGFEWRAPDGTPRRMNFFFGPMARSRPLRTDVLGVRVEPVSLARAEELGMRQARGLQVQASFPGTIAHLLGVGSGDVLLELDGRELVTPEDITTRMRERGEDEPVSLVWIDASGARQERRWDPIQASRPERPGASAVPADVERDAERDADGGTGEGGERDF